MFLEVFVAHGFTPRDTHVAAGIERPALRFDFLERGGAAQADVLCFWKIQQEVEPRVGREVENPLGVIRSGFIDTTATAGRCAGPFQLRALLREANFREAEENDAEDWAGIFLGLEAGVGAELIGGSPQTLFQRLSEDIFG